MEGDLIANLKRLESEFDPAIKAGFEIGQVMVVKRARLNHPDVGGAQRDRYQDISSRLTNSIKPGDIVEKGGVFAAEILAGTPVTDYAAAVEFGTPRSKAYPFMEPALVAARLEWFAVMKLMVKRAMT